MAVDLAKVTATPKQRCRWWWWRQQQQPKSSSVSDGSGNGISRQDGKQRINAVSTATSMSCHSTGNSCCRSASSNSKWDFCCCWIATDTLPARLSHSSGVEAVVQQLLLVKQAMVAAKYFSFNKQSTGGNGYKKCHGFWQQHQTESNSNRSRKFWKMLYRATINWGIQWYNNLFAASDGGREIFSLITTNRPQRLPELPYYGQQWS